MRRFTTHTLVALAVALASLCSKSAEAFEHVVELELSFSTTSDWARFAFEDMQIHIVQRELSVAGGAYVRSDGGFLAKGSYDTAKVGLKARIRAIVTGPKPRLVLSKGNVGQIDLLLRAGRKVLVDVRHDKAIPKDDDNKHYIALDPQQLVSLPGEKLKHHERLALGFYYGWYGTPSGPTGRWRHWNPGQSDHDSLNEPVGGWYDSLDPAVIERHCKTAKAAGLDGLVLSWWTNEKRNKRLLDLLQPAAIRHGLRLSIYIETASSAKSLRSRLKTLISGAAQHKSWLRADGKPVFFLYTRVLGALKPIALTSAIVGLDAYIVADTLDVSRFGSFDALHTYYIARKTEQYRQRLRDLLRLTRLSGKRLIATVMPGYNDTPVRSPGFVRGRAKGRFLRACFRAAIGADWVLLTSFNEWHEGSEIEPSKEHGDSYLGLFNRAVQRWKAGP